MYTTGLRTETVVGMETPLMPYMAAVGARSGSALSRSCSWRAAPSPRA